MIMFLNMGFLVVEKSKGASYYLAFSLFAMPNTGFIRSIDASQIKIHDTEFYMKTT